MTPTLAVMVCGSVDDGKSTLVGRLLTECGAIAEDQVVTDPAHVTDGLEAEREQGITIDVGHRQFHTGRRRIHLLDCPGHEQYTRNMATAASQADLAVVLVDATLGLRRQTRRHVLIARLMGVRRFIFVVNKMDLAGFDPARFAVLAAELRTLDAHAPILPACARDGDGIAHPGRTSWHPGPTLLQALDDAAPAEPPGAPFRMPIQSVIRGPAGERLLAGTVVAGRIAAGDAILAGDGPPTRLRAITGPGGPQPEASEGEAVTLLLEDQRDAGRGLVLSHPATPVPMGDRFTAHLVWCADPPLATGRSYLVKLGTSTVPGSITAVRHVVDMDTGLPVAAGQLGANDVGVVHLLLAAPVASERFADCPPLGRFILIDRADHATVAAGTIEAGEHRAENVAWQALTVDAPARAALLGQRPVVAWFTGLSGAGKSTVANRVEAMLHAARRATYLLDGDNLRHNLNADLGFSARDRVENVRRVGEVAALMADAGLIVLVCLISPYRAGRDAVRTRVGAAFIEVFVDAPVDVCRKRDPKGLYGKADRGEIQEFTGVSAPYEPPHDPELHIRTDHDGVDATARMVLDRILAA